MPGFYTRFHGGGIATIPDLRKPTRSVPARRSCGTGTSCGIVQTVLRLEPGRLSRALGAVVVAGLAYSSGHAQNSPAAGQHAGHAAPPAAFAKRISLYKTALGPFTRPISSKNPEAQAFFNQGFQLTYAFAKPEAVRSFREAETRDPVCAICYWGEAWAWGSDLNWVMGPEEAPFVRRDSEGGRAGRRARHAG